MPFKAYYLARDGELHRGLDEEGIRSALASGEGLLWVDVTETTQEDGRFLEQTFSFHPLAVEDCVEGAIHDPKVDAYQSYLFMVFHGINYTVTDNVLQTTELALFLGSNFVVSNHNFFLYSVEAVTRLVELDGRPMRHGVDFFAHALIDALVNNITPAMDQLVLQADAIEEDIFSRLNPETLEAILQLKRSSLRLRRAMAPQREVLNQLSRGEFGLISSAATVFYRDIYDDMARLEGLVYNLRERTDTILATYMSAVAIQQNESMKTLSLIAAIFLPLTLLAGIYGMNFEFMPELGYRYSYFIVLVVMVSVAGGVAWWFWARRWITAGRRQLERFVPAAVDPERLVNYMGYMPWWRRPQ